MRKSHPFERERKNNYMEAGVTGRGHEQWWRRAAAGGSLWGNEMIIRVLTEKWIAIVGLMLGVIIDFLLVDWVLLLCASAK